ncbi:hypothetical protein ABPG72_001040, partial [Tetrahymena utriculariae]
KRKEKKQALQNKKSFQNPLQIPTFLRLFGFSSQKVNLRIFKFYTTKYLHQDEKASDLFYKILFPIFQKLVVQSLYPTTKRYGNIKINVFSYKRAIIYLSIYKVFFKLASGREEEYLDAS